MNGSGDKAAMRTGHRRQTTGQIRRLHRFRRNEPMTSFAFCFKSVSSAKSADGFPALAENVS
jgi:hypothetical protein